MYEAPSITQTPTPKDHKNTLKNAPSRPVYSETYAQHQASKHATIRITIITITNASTKLGPGDEFGAGQRA
jgi:hypothetical protein